VPLRNTKIFVFVIFRFHYIKFTSAIVLTSFVANYWTTVSVSRVLKSMVHNPWIILTGFIAFEMHVTYKGLS